MRFYTKAEVFRIENDPITLRDWVHERDYYTRIQLLTKYFSSRKYIFVIESEMLTIPASNKQEFMISVSDYFLLFLHVLTYVSVFDVWCKVIIFKSFVPVEKFLSM